MLRHIFKFQGGQMLLPLRSPMKDSVSVHSCWVGVRTVRPDQVHVENIHKQRMKSESKLFI